MKTIMKNITLLLVLVALAGCKQDNYTFYTEGRDAIYFDLPERSRDSMDISLARYTAEEAVIKLPMALAGYSSPEVRYFKVRVVPEKTTAVEGLHYRALDEEYPFRADELFDSLSVVFFPHKDPALLDDTRRLYIEIVPTDDLGAGISYMQHADMRFGSGLVRPTAWFFDSSDPRAYPVWYQFYLGDYSRVKHATILELFHLDEIPDKWDNNNVATWDSRGMRLNKYFIDNPTQDENGNIITPWR